ncbi:mechanosensitive ion channel family protein [Candidatus Woesearchaeota archaeon]|nr:mechanosensitive ion channel family protein [Candidatus Woesearchaeota archaeon]
MSFLNNFLAAADNIVAAITPLLNRVVIALVILFVGFILGKIVGRFLFRVLDDLNLDGLAKRLLGKSLSLERSISAVVAALIYLIAIIMALNALGLTTAVLSAIIIIVLILVGISVLLAIKDLVPNLSAGMMIKQKDIFREGDTVSFNGTSGVVEEFSLFETRLRSKGNEVLIVPNNLFAKHTVKRKRPRKVASKEKSKSRKGKKK